MGDAEVTDVIESTDLVYAVADYVNTERVF